MTSATVTRCQALADTIREHTDPRTCSECCALLVLVDGLLQIARQQMAAPMVEALLAQALRELQDAA